MKRLSLIVRGNVQGVGFRYHVNMKAVKNGITGFVRNLEDGTVLIEAQGPEAKLKEFREQLPKGLIFARIDSISEEEIPRDISETKFRVRY